MLHQPESSFLVGAGSVFGAAEVVAPVVAPALEVPEVAGLALALASALALVSPQAVAARPSVETQRIERIAVVREIMAGRYNIHLARCGLSPAP